jgi:hypothetical protein
MLAALTLLLCLLKWCHSLPSSCLATTSCQSEKDSIADILNDPLTQRALGLSETPGLAIFAIPWLLTTTELDRLDLVCFPAAQRSSLASE